MAPVLVALALLVLLLPTASADDGATKAKELLTKYKSELRDSRDISDGPGWNAFVRRLRALRELGELDCPASRAGLQRIARTGKRLDDRILAAQGLARSSDLASVRQAVEAAGKKGHAVLTQATAEALRENKHAPVLQWVARAATDVTSKEALSVILRAGTKVELGAPILSTLFDDRIGKSSAAEVLFDIVRALGRTGGPEAVKRILQAASHMDIRLRLAAADVLPAQPQGDAVDAAIRRLLNDDSALVRYAMLMALGEAKALYLVPEISERLADKDRRTRKTALDVLKRMTKQDFGFDMGAWRRWHQSKEDGGEPGPNTVPSYYGVPIWSDRLAFILDKSGSMGWPFDPAVTTRMAVAQAELNRVLGILPKRTLFNVVSFASKVSLWRKSEAQANEKTIASAVRWSSKQESKRGAFTNTFGVLERTLLQNPRIDTVYLLSDGIPEWGDIISREGLLAAVRDWNRFRRVTINTFAITHMSLNPGKYVRKSSMKRAEVFMRDLAAAGGGTYRFVKRPPK